MKSSSMTCDKCGQRAEYNIKSALNYYSISDKEEYKSIDCVPDGKVNDFLCEGCFLASSY